MVEVSPAASVLDRPFAVVAFDWDGTAVVDRRDTALALGRAMDELLRAGGVLAIVTGTRFEHVDRPLAVTVRGPHKRNLHVYTNRGSEHYGYDASSEAVLIERRVATAEENRLLDRVAARARDVIAARTGLPVVIVHDRLNRRKIDLIPEWADPPKARIGELARRVERRLADAGWTGGVGAAIALVTGLAREEGLPDARVTSDVKHVEVGLTDKSDAIARIIHGLAEGRPERVLLVGDEFGRIGGGAEGATVEGSDARMRTAFSAGMTSASVGPEPGGVPEGVVHLGGGPPRFRALLMAQTSARPRTPRAVATEVTRTRDARDVLVEEGFTLEREHEIESCFTVANGRAGVRGSLSEGSPLSAPATWLAGVFVLPEDGGIARLARGPEWTRLSIRSNSDVFHLARSPGDEHVRVLDLAQGILWRVWRHEDPAGRVTRLRITRWASIADRRLLGEQVEIAVENWSGELRIVANVECPRGWDAVGGTRCRGPVPFGHAATLRDSDGREVAGDADGWRLPARPGSRWILARAASVGEEDLARSLATAEPHRALGEHATAWTARRDACDVEVTGNDDLQRALRFACHHLIGSADPETERVSIGARGLTGAAYMGHVFWDTEIWLIPFYALTWPRAARALLMYRWHTLPAARARARTLGYAGALYAWESADTGEDVTPRVAWMPDGRVVPILSGALEHHVSAAVAYAVWMYWELTRDDLFLVEAGAEMLLDTARFWASRGGLEGDGRVHIRGVVGPDEYHENVDDNAYTNGMARWNLRRGVEVARLVCARWPTAWARIASALSIDAAELARWESLAEAMYTGLDAQTGIIEQFRGYFDLEPVDLAALEPRSVTMDMLLGHDRIARTHVIKQADVVLLLHLLWDEFPPAVREANFRYYEPRCGHGSSLSPPIHALVAARLGDTALAERYFRQTAEIDLSDRMGNAAGGVHVGALGGLWQAATLGFGGLRFGEEGPRLEPALPRCVERLAFPFEWRRERFRAEVTPRGATLRRRGRDE